MRWLLLLLRLQENELLAMRTAEQIVGAIRIGRLYSYRRNNKRSRNPRIGVRSNRSRKRYWWLNGCRRWRWIRRPAALFSGRFNLRAGIIRNIGLKWEKRRSLQIARKRVALNERVANTCWPWPWTWSSSAAGDDDDDEEEADSCCSTHWCRSNCRLVILFESTAETWE